MWNNVATTSNTGLTLPNENDEDTSPMQSGGPSSKSPAGGSALLYKVCRIAPRWLGGVTAAELGKDIRKAQPEELNKLLTKFEESTRSNIKFGGQQMTEGLEGLASEVYKFIPADGSVTSEFLRALQIIEKWTTDAKTQKSLGNYSRIVNIVNTLHRSRADNASDATKVAATEEVNKVLKKAFAFINDPALRGTGKDLDDAKSKLAFTVSAADKIQINITKAHMSSPSTFSPPINPVEPPGPEATKAHPFI